MGAMTEFINNLGGQESRKVADIRSSTAGSFDTQFKPKRSAVNPPSAASRTQPAAEFVHSVLVFRIDRHPTGLRKRVFPRIGFPS